MDLWVALQWLYSTSLFMKIILQIYTSFVIYFIFSLVVLSIGLDTVNIVGNTVYFNDGENVNGNSRPNTTGTCVTASLCLVCVIMIVMCIEYLF